MVYTFINAISTSYTNIPNLENMENQRYLGETTLQNWIEKYPNNQRLKNKQNKFQSLMNNY